jgi:superfamily II DNA helicase RecQ
VALLPVAACRRPNIELARGRKTLGALADALSPPGALPALVYAQTRKDVELIADKLTEVLGEGAALRYHAGMTNPNPNPNPNPKP